MDSGIDLLRRDFLFISPNPFKKFQASFNLESILVDETGDSPMAFEKETIGGTAMFIVRL